jgi:hypothetical protein
VREEGPEREIQAHVEEEKNDLSLLKIPSDTRENEKSGG